MGFCYPGKGKSGDLPPRKECAVTWHSKVLDQMKQVELTILIGTYAIDYYLGDRRYKTLTETIQHYDDYLQDGIIVLPHPSPRNNIWLKKNPWFGVEIIPRLQAMVQSILE